MLINQIKSSNYGEVSSGGAIDASRKSKTLDYAYRSLAFRQKRFSPLRAGEVTRAYEDYDNPKSDFERGFTACLGEAQDARLNRADTIGEIECDLFEVPCSFFQRVLSWVCISRDSSAWREQQDEGLLCSRALSQNYGSDLIKSACDINGIERFEIREKDSNSEREILLEDKKITVLGQPNDSRVTTHQLRKIYDHIDRVVQSNLAVANAWLEEAMKVPHDWAEELYRYRNIRYLEGDRLDRLLDVHEIAALKGAVLDDLRLEPWMHSPEIMEKGAIVPLVKPYFQIRVQWLEESKHRYLKHTAGLITYRVPGESLIAAVRDRFEKLKVSNARLAYLQMRCLTVLEALCQLHKKAASPLKKYSTGFTVIFDRMSIEESRKKLSAKINALKEHLLSRSDQLELEHVSALLNAIRMDLESFEFLDSFHPERV